MARGTRSENVDTDNVDADNVDAAVDLTSTETAAEEARRKGRATPKRTDARQARAAERKAAPQNRKEAAAARRASARAARESLTSTDVSKLPERERRPELVYARDLVDSRAYPSQTFFWLLIATLLVSFVIEVAIFATFVAFIGLIVTSWLDARSIGKKVDARFPNSTVRVRAYAGRRVVAPRRTRRPVPRLNRGDEVR
jgi:hypothetical protein